MPPIPRAKPEPNPAMIILAREARGITQKELAAALSVTQGLISKIESGFRSATPEFLNQLSRELGYPVEFFYLPDRIYGLGIGELFHRKRQDVPIKTLLRIHAVVNIYRMNLERLLDAVELPECRIPNMKLENSDVSIEEIARFIRERWKLPRGPISNLCNAIEDAGGIVVSFDFKTTRVDAVSHWAPPLPPLFFINSQVLTDRMRYTLAHEIGHMVMHQSSHAYIDLADSSEAERQADRFAAELLMPERDISPQLIDIDLPKLALLKGYWKVSMAALLKRAADLGHVSPRRARTLWAEMARKGYRRREPVNLDLPIERPSLLDELITLYQQELGYTPNEMGHLLAMDEAEVRSWYFKQGPLRLV